MKSDHQKWLTRLFDANELICAPDDVTGTAETSLETLLGQAPTQFTCVNALRGHRSDANVAIYRNLLFEFDKGSIEEQMAKLVELRVPYTSLVFSGNKSLHCILSLKEPLANATDYAHVYRTIRYILFESDPTARNPSRLTRTAGATRSDTGHAQELIDLRPRLAGRKLGSWLSHFHAHIQRCEEREKEAAEERQRRFETTSGEGIEAVDPWTIAFLEGRAKTKGSRHARLFAAACELVDCGVDFDTTLTYIEKAADLHGITADPKRLGEAASIVKYAFSR